MNLYDISIIYYFSFYYIAEISVSCLLNNLQVWRMKENSKFVVEILKIYFVDNRRAVELYLDHISKSYYEFHWWRVRFILTRMSYYFFQNYYIRKVFDRSYPFRWFKRKKVLINKFKFFVENFRSFFHLRNNLVQYFVEITK